MYHIDLYMLNHPCELAMNPTWLWCMTFFCVLLDSVCYFVKNFCIYIHQIYWPVCICFGGSLSSFGNQGDGGIIKCLWQCSHLFSFLEALI